MLHWLKDRARALKRDVHALALAARDPRVPLAAKLLALAVVGYALSPIDVIPDFIPVLGSIDDLVLLPLGILLAVRMVPPDVMAELRARATAEGRLPASRRAAWIIAAVWGVALALAALWLWRVARR